MEKARRILLMLALGFSFLVQVTGQENKIYSNMSLNELLNIDVVVTASKQPEDLFEAPLSVTIIKKEEIMRSGATSIPEALRLAPGLIVREITPGNYDVHIRGYDDITKNVYITLPYNTTTLVMIDNRIVYNYFTGGTLWETFPIDINDIEQIEVVRGPASALYGPNAVTGVINIITTHANKSGMNAFVNGLAGSDQAKNASANIGYNWNDKTKLSFSGNFSERHRYNEGYYDLNTNSYVSSSDLSMIIAPLKEPNTTEVWNFKEYQEKLGAYYDEDLSLRKMGGNIFFSHNLSEQSNIDISMGAQRSQSQKTGFLNLATSLSQIESQSGYLNAKIKHKNLFGQFNLNRGEDLSNYQFNSYKFTNVDANLEYYMQFNNLSFRPGISYKSATYNSPLTYNEPLSWTTMNYPFKDEPRIITTYAASMLSEWKPTSKMRVIGAVRVDKTNINKNYSINYEIASTYRINKNNLVRYVYSRANKSPFIFDSYLNSNLSLVFDYTSEGNKVPIRVPVDFNIVGNQNLKYPSITNQEISWRTKIKPNVSLDVELFYSRVKNFVNPNVYRNIQTVQQLNQLGQIDSIVSINTQGNVIFENYDLCASQIGAGFTFNYEYSNKVNIKLHGNYQKTHIWGRTGIDFETTNLQIGQPTPDYTVEVKLDSKMNPTQWSENLTPSFVGGFLLNYKPGNKWNFTTDGYIYTGQKFVNYDYYSMVDERGGANASVQMNIKSNMLLNAKASYRFNKHVMTYTTFKNIFGYHREYGFADGIGRLFLVGVQWEL